MCLLVILVSDLLPIVTQMLCIWIQSKGNWESLMSGFLHRPLNDDEISTYAGSNLLSNLRFELDHHNHTIDQDDDWAVRDSITQYRQACIFEATEQDRAVTSESFMETLGYCEKGTTLLDR